MDSLIVDGNRSERKEPREIDRLIVAQPYSEQAQHARVLAGSGVQADPLCDAGNDEPQRVGVDQPPLSHILSPITYDDRAHPNRASRICQRTFAALRCRQWCDRPILLPLA